MLSLNTALTCPLLTNGPGKLDNPLANTLAIPNVAPSSIEVMTTKDAKLSITDLQALLNDLSGRMNEMDQRLKIFSGQTILLSQQLEELKKKIEIK